MAIWLKQVHPLVETSPINCFWQNPTYLTFLRIPKKQQTKEMLLAAIKGEPSALECRTFHHNILKKASERIIDRETALVACNKDGINLSGVPCQFVDKDMCLAAVHSYPQSLRFVPEENINKEIVLSAVTCPTDFMGDGLESAFRQRTIDIRHDLEIVKKAIRNCPMAIRWIPEELIDQSLVEQVIGATVDTFKDLILLGFDQYRSPRYDITDSKMTAWPIQFVPNRFLTKSLVELSLRVCPRSVGGLTGEYASKKFLTRTRVKELIERDCTCATLFPEPIRNAYRELFPTDELSNRRNEDPTTGYLDLGSIASRSSNEDVLVKELPKPTETVKAEALDRVANQQTTHRLASKPLKTEWVCYISDLHVEHQLDLTGLTRVEVREAMRPKARELVASIVRSTSIILFSGDIANNLEVTLAFFETFYEELKRRGRGYVDKEVVFIPGNHELWSWDCSSTTPTVTSERLARFMASLRNTEASRLTVMQGGLLVKASSGHFFAITESAVLESSIADLNYNLGDSPLVLVCGTGYSGLNPSGLPVFSDQNEENEASKRFRMLHEMVGAAASGQQVVVATHYPVDSWLGDDLHQGWVYVSGHTHLNTIESKGGATILADNQIGYTPRPWTFKSFSFDGKFDLVSMLSNGIHEISRESYITFYSRRSVVINTNRKGRILCLKRGRLYMFVLEASGSLFLLDGGNVRRLDKSLEYYYKYMQSYANKTKEIIRPAQAVLQTVASVVKEAGGDGTVHGLIVDVDIFHHIYVDLTCELRFYYAESKGVWQEFESLSDLLQSKSLLFEPRCRMSLDKYDKSLVEKGLAFASAANSPNPLAANSPKESLRRSKTFSALSYLTACGVIRIWNENLLPSTDSLRENRSKTEALPSM